MGYKETQMIISIFILAIMYFLTTKIYKWWMKVGVYIYKGIIIWEKQNKQGIFKGLKSWYSNRYKVCLKCNSNGCLSMCCNSKVEYIKHPHHIKKRATQCLQCGIICNFYICTCRKG